MYKSSVIETQVDVSQNDQVTTWTHDTVRYFGRLDGAANVAGIAMGEGTSTCETMVCHNWP